jgi:serine/threonine protein phosphatase 1
MGKTFVIADCHGAYRALKQCLQRSNFDYDNDLLINLGDVCDGWTETKLCVDELLKIKHRVDILGNHDWWFLEYIIRNEDETNSFEGQQIWLSQGGYNTLKSYEDVYNGKGWTSKKTYTIPESHKEYFKNLQTYYLDDKKRLFVHGGIPVGGGKKSLERKSQEFFMWDREFIQACIAKQSYIDRGYKKNYKMHEFKEVFVGHTTVEMFRKNGKVCYEPLNGCNAWLLDTGGGWSGKLTILDVDTKEYWQSDFVYTLYPNEKGRG